MYPYEIMTHAMKMIEDGIDELKEAMKAHCTKCGEIILGDQDSICGKCAGDGPEEDA